MEKELLENFVPAVIMTKQEEQQLAQKWVDMFNAQEGFESLDRLALGKHLANIAKLASDMMTQEALQLTKALIDNHAPDDNEEPIAVNKQFTFHGNKWLYQIKETYGQLGSQRLSNGELDPNSQTYRTLEADYAQTKDHMKALTAQMNGLQARILDDHNLQPTEISVVLQLKEAK